MKRILQIVPSLELGGTEAFIMNHYRAIDRREYQLDFLVFAEKEWPYLQEIEKLGGRVFYACQPSLLSIRKFYRCFKNVMMMGGPYTAVHCHADAGNAVPLFCGMLCGISVRISHAHGIVQLPQKWMQKVVFRLRKSIIRFAATKWLACSKTAGGLLYGESFFAKRGAVINDGICVEAFVKPDLQKVEALKEKFGITYKNDLVIGNISRFDANKNQLFVLSVFQHVLRKNPNAILLLGGVDAGYLSKAKEYVSEMGLENSVRFVGKRRDIPECLKLIDVYLFPTIREGFGIALLEAQAAGCLCIASTGVPTETDMGLGNVSYLSLRDGAVFWAEFILRKIHQHTKHSEDTIYDAFEEKGFSMRKSLDRLLKHYE